MSDIVTRLRNEYESCECGITGDGCSRCHTDNEAADEIERLRAELETYKDLYASEIVKKAVRGE
jgi:hypothetical protein